MICKNCKRKDEIKEGICLEKKAEDGLPFRCTGPWSKEKLDILQRYIEIFTIAMKKKWKLVYIDLFAGPGKCFDYINEVFFDSSPIISAKHYLLFDKLIFVEKEEKYINYLKERIKGPKNVEFLPGDCNEIIDSILKKIPSKSLCLFFVDPTGLQFKFLTLNKILSSKNNCDIIELFPYEIAIKRNLEKWQKSGESKPLDEFLGVEGSIKKLGLLRNYYKPIIKMYKDSINSIAPKYTEDFSSQTLRSSVNAPLYHLFFISSSTLGKDFFKKALKNSKGQQTLPHI